MVLAVWTEMAPLYAPVELMSVPRKMAPRNSVAGCRCRLACVNRLGRLGFIQGFYVNYGYDHVDSLQANVVCAVRYLGFLGLCH